MISGGQSLPISAFFLIGREISYSLNDVPNYLLASAVTNQLSLGMATGIYSVTFACEFIMGTCVVDAFGPVFARAGSHARLSSWKRFYEF